MGSRTTRRIEGAKFPDASFSGNRPLVTSSLLLVGSLLAIPLAACTTPYQPVGCMGGFSSLQLNSDVYRISFRGNGYSSEERVIDFTLLRAAELTLSHGAQYFFVAGERRSESHTSGGSYSQGYIQSTPNGAYYQGYTGPDIEVVRHQAELVIQIIRGTPPEGVVTYDASVIANQVRAKYGITDKYYVQNPSSP